MLPARIQRKIAPVPIAGCWLWTGAGGRYGTVHLDGRNQRAHRAVFRLTGNHLPHNRELLHTCDTGLCVNPAHMVVGTHQDNMDDMVRKGRARAPSGDAHWSRAQPERARAVGRQNIVRTHAAGFENANAKVTQEVIDQVRAAHRANPRQSMSALGQPFGIGRETTRKIVKGIAPWKL